MRRVAEEQPGTKFTALLHHLSVDLLRESFYALKRKAAPGVDGVTWQEYETGLEGRWIDLHSRVHRGAFLVRNFHPLLPAGLSRRFPDIESYACACPRV